MKRIVFRSIAIVLMLMVGALLYDLYYPRTAKMREFDPNQVARLETAMWRSYYDKKQVQLFNQFECCARSIMRGSRRVLTTPHAGSLSKTDK